MTTRAGEAPVGWVSVVPDAQPTTRAKAFFRWVAPPRAANPPYNLRVATPVLLATLAVALAAPSAAAQVMKVEIGVAVEAQPVGEQPPAAPDGIVEDEAVVAPPEPAGFHLSDEQFDMWVFGSSNRPRGGRIKLEALLDLHVEEVARECGLSALNRQKLTLAGRGDIKRFLERVEEKRKVFNKFKNDQNKVGEIYQEILPLQQVLQGGLFNEGSLYSKTLRRVADEAGSEHFRETLREKERFRYRAKVELVVAQLDQSLGLSDRQRQALVDLILRETPPPKQYGQYVMYLVLYQMGKIHRDRLKPLFEPRQWEFLTRHLDQMRGMEQFLRTQGLLPPREKSEAQEIAEAFAEALHEPPARQERADLPADVFGATDAAKGAKP